MAVKLADSGPSVLLFTKESGNLRAMKIIVLSQKKHHVSLLPTSRPRLFRLANVVCFVGADASAAIMSCFLIGSSLDERARP
jgi:hypothetical protein